MASSPQTVIDVSQWQGKIDWAKVKGNVAGAIIRIGYGNNQTNQDDRWAAFNIAECERLGIPWGPYVYSYAYTKEMVQSEYAHLKRICKGHKLSFPWYIDLEEGSLGYFAKTAAQEWYRLCKADKVYPGIYTFVSYYNSYMKGTGLADASWWIASFGTNNGKPQTKPNIGIDYDAWQYTSVGRVNGISGNVDMSLFYKDFTGGVKPAPAPQPTPQPQPVDVSYYYAVKLEDGRVLPEVKDLNDYAGIPGRRISGIAVRSNKGTVKYQAHVLGGGWLPWVTGYNWADYNNGYAGARGKVIDAIRIDSNEPVQYRVSPLGGNYYPWQNGIATDKGQDGYAGVIGRAIDRVQIHKGS